MIDIWSATRDGRGYPESGPALDQPCVMVRALRVMEGAYQAYLADEREKQMGANRG